MRRLPLPVGALLGVLVLLTGCGDGTTAATEASDAPTSGGTVSASPSDEPRPTRTAEPEPGLTVPIRVMGDQITPNAEVLEVDAGEPISLRIRSDRAGELHVHSSPETFVDFGPGRTSAELVIERPGSVEVEEHDSGALVLKLLVS